MMTKRLFRIPASIRAASGKEEGSALVELAVSFSLLTLILLGACEFGRVAYTAIEVSNAAHAGALYGASSHYAAGDWTLTNSAYSGGVVNAATADSANTSGLTITNISLACTCADPSYTPSSCSDNDTCSSNKTAMVETITVQTQATYQPLFQFPRKGSFTLHGAASQVVSNQ